MGQLVAIHTGMTSFREEEKESLAYAELVYGSGLVQANTAGGVVNIVENEVYVQCQENDFDFEPGDFGEHLTVEWVALDTLQLGDILIVGDEVQIEVMGPYHIPDWIDNLTELLSVVEEPIGVQGKVVSGGNIAVDTMVHVQLETSEENF